MPYIKKERRPQFEKELNSLNDKIENEGDLNYFITKLCHNYIEKNGKSYILLNAVHGVLNCADKELYRRVTAPYEDLKIKENGDI